MPIAKDRAVHGKPVLCRESSIPMCVHVTMDTARIDEYLRYARFTTYFWDVTCDTCDKDMPVAYDRK